MSKQELIAWTVGSLSNAQRTVKGYCLHITLKLLLCQNISTLLCLLLILMSAFALKILFVFQKKKKRKKQESFLSLIAHEIGENQGGWVENTK